MVRTAAGQVYLVGFMGAGKTTVGRQLASLLGWEFADLDEMICRDEGKSIPEIFRDQGEPHFRLREREALLAVTAIPRLVVATGGGTYVAEENRNLVEAAGWSVWLQVSLAEAWRRVAGSAARPMMASRSEVEGLFRFRQEFYRCARLRIDTERLPPGRVAPEILESLLESGFQPA